MNKIVLASSSPRRKELLERFNLNHLVVKSHIEEKIDPKDGPYEFAMSLAFQKAYDIGKQYRSSIVIGADTIVVFEKQILGKPKNDRDARDILSQLSGKEHKVITAIAVICLEKNIKVVDYEETIVKFRKLDESLIQRYISTGEPFDKAGAYGIQGYGGLLVEKINGCYDNVMGLPMGKLNQILVKHFNINIL